MIKVRYFSFFFGIIVLFSGCNSQDQSQNNELVPEEISSESSSYICAQDVDQDKLLKTLFHNDFNTPEYYSEVERNIKFTQNNIITDKAILSKDISLCDKIESEEKNNCKNRFHLSKSIESNDENDCNQITDDFLKNHCKGELYNKKAQESGDVTVCTKHDSLINQENCENTFYNMMAIKENKKEYCENIKNNDVKQGCLQVFATTTTVETPEVIETVEAPEVIETAQ